MYPMKFKPLCFDKIWGGNKIKKLLHPNLEMPLHCGESWEVSGVPGKISEVANGFLAGNGLDELIEVYMSDLVGESVFQQYGNSFPLLVKFIDAHDNLSVQVHPDDSLAQRRYGTNGKTEAWVVLQAEEDAGLYVGFRKGVTRDEYLSAVAKGTVDQLLAFYPVKAGDAFFIPAGTVHAIGKGVLLAEIQQTSDCTYRIFDWNRVDAQGHARELHTDEALEAIHFDAAADYRLSYEHIPDKTVPVVKNKYFNINALCFYSPLEKVYARIDSFVIYICVDGVASLVYEGEETEIQRGEVVLLPAIATEMALIPHGSCQLLEVYIA